MSVALTYPGVYVEEIPSGVRTITGVATSIAAFAGWAAKGPIDRAELVLNWSDYVRTFGGLDTRSLLGYAVSQFFANGGQRAYIVRLVMPEASPPPDPPPPPDPNQPVAKAAASAKVTLAKLDISARNPGSWANDYAIVTKTLASDPTRFRLTVANFTRVAAGIATEVFENLSMKADDPRFVQAVLKSESALIYAKANGEDPPPDTVMAANGAIPDGAKLTGGDDGDTLNPNDAAFETALDLTNATNGIYLLDRIDLFNLLCVPGETKDTTIQSLQKFCRDRRAFLIADCAKDVSFNTQKTGPGNVTGNDAINAAFYFPWLIAPDPLAQNRPREFPPCGYMAGIYARTDTQRGVWKAPAGSEASLTGVIDTVVRLTDDENGVLNPLAVNCIRSFPTYGIVAWGARTLQGNDERGSEWKYVPVRRTALFIEETLFRATKWVVFEPNDEPLWASIRLNIGAFMHDLFRQGAFQGSTPKDAYFVKCDKETTTQSDINKGIVNIVVGFAPLKPAEFVVIQLQQIAGDIQT